MPARPGAYTTAARLFTEDGGSLRIPITIEVAASFLWGIAAMLLGLFCLGLIDGLAEEGAIKSQLRDALSARQEIRTWLEANPAPQIRSGEVEAMDRDFDAAVTALSRRRRLSIVEHRADDAAPHLIRLARASGLTAAIAATEANDDRARALDLRLVTPAEELVVGRRITVAVARMDPVWGTGVRVGVDFGDGAPPYVGRAEQLRQGRAITHEYAAPLTRHLRVVAAKDLKPGSIEPADAALGEGATSVLIAPSPVSRAERLADDFLNLRFAIALLIALVVYYWRFHSKTTIFGARSIDYAEAFVLGFAANAAVTNLPDALAKVLPRARSANS